VNEHAPTTATTNPEPLKVVLVDQSKDAQDEARDLADARLDRELGEGGKIRQFLNGIWKGNLARDFYRQRYVSQALETIQTSNNVLADSPAERRARALESTIERFQSEHDEVIHESAGERREVQAADSVLAVGVKNIIRQAVERAQTSGRPLNVQVLQEERNRFLNEYRKQHGEDALGKGIVMADNMFDIAQTVYGVVEHGESLDHALGRLEVVTGEARNGARTEAKYTAVDKSIDWLSKKGLASFITPGALATGVAAGMAIARVTGHGVVGAATKTLLPGVAAGAWAALRENKRTKDDRSQHAREMAVGGEFAQDDKRRTEMERTRYESVAAVELITQLQEASTEERLEAGGNDALQAALDALAAAQARIQLSDSRNIDLVSYSSKEDVGEERMMLDLARREARLAVEQRLTPEARAALNLGPTASARGLIDQRALLFSRVLIEGEEGQEGIDQKDAAFAKLKAKRVATAAAIGVATGVVGGLVVQETVAAFDSTRFGLIDAIRGETAVPFEGTGEVHQTILEGMIRGDETIIHTDAADTYEAYPTGENGSIEVTSDHTLETNEDGTLSLIDGNGKASVEGLVIDANGTLDQASLDKLEAAGMVVEDKSFDETIQTQTTEQVSTDQYIQNHAAETTRVTRDLWYGNDTPGVFDQNELRVYRGGSDAAPGIVEGGYQYTVAGMTQNGSWQGGERVDWNQAASNGNLFVAISGTYDSQGNPFMIPIGPDGAVNIPADSPAGQFFANENNSVAFNGAYMEIVQTTGQDAEGVVHIRPLATLVGDTSVELVNDTVTTESIVHHAEYSITTNGYDTAQANATETAPITPIASRRSMEALRNEGSENTPETSPATPSETASGYGYENGRISPDRLRRWESERSPRLRENPDAELETLEEVDFYYEQQRQRRGEAYVQEIEANVDQSEALQAIDTDSRAIIVMPVGAAQESENIYEALSLYAQQDEDAQKKTTILLNVNWISDATNDPEKKAKIDKTLSEIQRAQADFPQLNIAQFTKVWDRDWVDGVRNKKIYGEVIKTLYDTAAFAVRRAIKEGRATPDQDLLLITNDADQKGMHRHYLQHYVAAEEQYKDSDAFIGTIRWGVETARDFPGYHVSQLFMQAMNIAATRPTNHSLAPATIGPNSAFRVSTYAAIGGCEDRDDLGVGADSELGRKVLAARGRLPEKSGNGYGGLGTTYLTGSTVGPGSRERVIRQVIGSDIDSAPGRLLDSAYRLDNFIPHAWNEFDNGSTREDDKNNPNLIIKEDARKDFAPIRQRVERQITDFINHWYPDQAVASFTLSMLFPDVPELKNNAQAWTLRQQSDGSYRFAFTTDGARRFKNSLLRSKGRFDPIANRLRRRVYGEVRPGAKIRPVAAEAPLVRATA
jgi:hypothetical protein